MSDQGDPGGAEASNAAAPDAEGADPIEAYETDDGVVLYDARNPLAWIESTRAVPFDEVA